MSLQRQHFLLSYLKTLNVGPVDLRPPERQSGALPTELNLSAYILIFWTSSYKAFMLSYLFSNITEPNYT